MSEISLTLLLVSILASFAVGLLLGFTLAVCAGIIIEPPLDSAVPVHFDDRAFKEPPRRPIPRDTRWLGRHVAPPPAARDPEAEFLGEWPPVPRVLSEIQPDKPWPRT